MSLNDRGLPRSQGRVRRERGEPAARRRSHRSVDTGEMVRRARWCGPVAFVVVLAAAVIAGAWLAGHLLPDGAATAEPSASPSPVIAEGRLRVPAVGLDAELRTMTVGTGRVVDPPSSDAAYLLVDHGVPPSRVSDGTVFVAMHALNAGGAPGNALTGPGGEVRVARGDVVEVDGVVFEVERVLVAGKREVAADADLWDAGVPGRGVTVHDLPSMSSEEISEVLRQPGAIIGGFCDSSACLAPNMPGGSR